MSPSTGKIIKISEIEEVIRLKAVDSTTKTTLSWFIEAALEAEVDLGEQAEVIAFCRYLIVCLSKTEDFLEYLLENNLDLLEVQEKLSD